ncbi:MAG: hypothetical protein AAF585_17310 [Verrucomicrobiota bacterium]
MGGPIHLADTGAGIYEGEPAKAGYMARDLAEFEEVYRGLAEIAIEHPQAIGFGWCGFYETPHPGGRSGLVDCKTGDPIPERLEIVKRWNQQLLAAERGADEIGVISRRIWRTLSTVNGSRSPAA